MRKIRIHRYENELWGRSHLPFFRKFDEYLSNFFDVEVVNYNTDGNTFLGKINLQSNISTFGTTPPISDVECVIENLKTSDIKVLSFTEYFTHYVCHFAKSESCSKILLSHFNWNHRYDWMRRERSVKDIGKISPWIFLPFKEFDYDYYRNLKKTNTNLEEKLFYLGSGIDSYRKSVKEVELKGYLQTINNYEFNEYLERMVNSKIALSHYLDLDKYSTPFDHPGEFCYRDIEYMSVGLPFIRIEYKDSVYDPLLPNHHYISIPREKAYVAYEKDKEKGVADLYIEKYLEVINDEELLNFISKNQIEWFDRNVKSPNIETLTFRLLELEKWLN
jgi:hypothetical protein